MGQTSNLGRAKPINWIRSVIHFLLNVSYEFFCLLLETDLRWLLWRFGLLGRALSEGGLLEKRRSSHAANSTKKVFPVLSILIPIFPAAIILPVIYTDPRTERTETLPCSSAHLLIYRGLHPHKTSLWRTIIIRSSGDDTLWRSFWGYAMQNQRHERLNHFIQQQFWKLAYNSFNRGQRGVRYFWRSPLICRFHYINIWFSEKMKSFISS